MADMPVPPEDGPAVHAYVAVPSDTNTLSRVSRGLYVGTSGSLRVLMASGADTTFPYLASGIPHPLAIGKIFATGTSATGIVVLE